MLIIRGKLQALEPTIPDWVASMHSTLASVARVSLMARRRGLLARKDTGRREVVEEHQWNASKSPWAEAEGLLEEWRLLKVMRRSERSEIICRRSCLVTMSG